MADIKKEDLVNSRYSEDQRVELTDDQLKGVQGGAWTPCVGIPANDGTADVLLSGVFVLWVEPGVGNHFCQVSSCTFVDGIYTEFDLECPAEGFIAYGVPANEVFFGN